MLPTAESQHGCLWCPSLDGVSNGTYLREDFSGRAFVRTRAGLTSHSHPQLHLLTICVVSSTYPNSSDTAENTARIPDTLNHLHLLVSPRSPSAQEAAKKTEPPAKLRRQYVTSRSFAPVLTSKGNGSGPGPALPSSSGVPGPSAGPSARSPCAPSSPSASPLRL